jgi:hypothetical protein
MRAGDTVQFDIALFDAAAAALSYADKAAFEAAGWSLTFIDMATGAAVSPALTYTLAPVAGVSGRHTVRLATTTATWLARVTPPSVNHTYTVLPVAIWSGDQYDSDSIYARLNSIYGITTSTTPVPSVTLPGMIEEDSYAATITVPTSYLARMGWTDLTGATMTGTIRRPDDIGTGTAAATLGATTPFVTINGTDPTAFDIRWDVWPAGMTLTTPERTAGLAVTFRVEVQAVKAGKTLTVLYNAPLLVSRQDDPT